MTIQEQRNDIEIAIRFLQGVIEKSESEKRVLTNAFNALGNGEDIYQGKSILAQEAKEIMRNINI